MSHRGKYVSAFAKSIAYARKDFQMDTSYIFSFMSRWIGISLSVITYYYLSHLISAKGAGYLNEYGGDYFTFIVLGMALASYVDAGLSGFSNSISREQSAGTLEVLITSPTPLYVLFFSFSLYNFFMGFLAALFFLFLGALLGVDFSFMNGPAIFLSMFLATIIFLSLGMISASFQLILRRGDLVKWLVGSFFWLFGGLFFPIAVLPESLQRISYCLPSTYLLKVVRLSFLKGYTVTMLKEELMILMIFAGFLGAVGILMLNKALDYSKKRGTISFR